MMKIERPEVRLVYGRADFEKLRDKARVIHLTGDCINGPTLEEILVNLAFAAGVKAAGGTLGF